MGDYVIDDVVANASRKPSGPYPVIYRVDIHPSGYLVMGIYLTLVGTVATIGNSTVLLVLLRYGTFKKRSINFLLINMAFSDLCVSFTGYPLTTISSYAGHWVFGPGGCQFNAFAVFTLSSSTMGTHAALAVYRYIYVCKHNIRPKLTPRLTIYVILFIWCHALFWTLTPFIGWSKYDFEVFGTSCSIDWVTRSFNNYSYMVLTTVGNFVIPVMLMIGCYWGIIRRSRKVDPLRVEERDRGMRIINKLDNMEMKIDNHVTRMCVAMTISFFVAWTPYTVGSLLAAYVPVVVGSVTSTLPTMLAKSSCMMNPLIYLASSSTFRRDVVKIFKRNKNQPMETHFPTHAQQATRRNEPNRQSGQFYVKNTTNPDGKSSMAIYFDTKQIYIGNTTPENIEKESSIVQRELDKISVRFSSQGRLNVGEKSSANRDSVKSTENPSTSEAVVESTQEYTNVVAECPSTSDSKRESQPTTTSPIFT